MKYKLNAYLQLLAIVDTEKTLKWLINGLRLPRLSADSFPQGD
jgi:hypothetical protein